MQLASLLAVLVSLATIQALPQQAAQVEARSLDQVAQPAIKRSLFSSFFGSRSEDDVIERAVPVAPSTFVGVSTRSAAAKTETETEAEAEAESGSVEEINVTIGAHHTHHGPLPTAFFNHAPPPVVY